MARKPNYAFEKNARAKAKAAKREAKRQARLANRAGNNNVEKDEPCAPSEPDGVANEPSE